MIIPKGSHANIDRIIDFFYSFRTYARRLPPFSRSRARSSLRGIRARCGCYGEARGSRKLPAEQPHFLLLSCSIHIRFRVARYCASEGLRFLRARSLLPSTSQSHCSFLIIMFLLLRIHQLIFCLFQLDG